VVTLPLTGWQSCWLGVFRDTITRNVEFNENVNADPEADEIANNSVGHNLNCAGNSPSPQHPPTRISWSSGKTPIPTSLS
jgi:hypothetical protein